MTFEKFIQEVENGSIDIRIFYVLKEPVEILDPRTGKTFKIAALSITGPTDERPFLVALAIDCVSKRSRLTTLARYFGPSASKDNIKEEWTEARNLFFSQWVREWLARHPDQLVLIGIEMAMAALEKDRALGKLSDLRSGFRYF